MTRPKDAPSFPVKPGDRMSRIAALKGYPNAWALWNHAWNAELKAKRPNLEILNPDGDVVYLPPLDPSSKAFADKDEAKHAQDTKLPTLKLHFSCAGKPLASRAFTLIIDTDPYSKDPNAKDPKKPPFVDKTKATDPDGYIEVQVRPEITEARIRFEDLRFECHLLVGHLRPLDVAGGPQQRLQNLGYACPVVAPTAPAAKKEFDGKVSKAVRRFQHDAGASQTGELAGGSTLTKLQTWAHPTKVKDYWVGKGDPTPVTLQVPAAAPAGATFAVRDYYVTTNTDVHVSLPWMAVTVRCALFLPPSVSLGTLNVAGETWSSGRAVEATFQRAKAPLTDGPVDLEALTDLKAERQTSVKAGVAFTDVDFSRAIGEEGGAIMGNARGAKAAGGMILALAKIPLVGLWAGAHLLEIVPPAEETTHADGPAGPQTDIPDPGLKLPIVVPDSREHKVTYRPLFLRYTLNGALEIAATPETARLDKDRKVVVHAPPAADGTPPAQVPLAGGGMADRWINHGYVTAWARDEIAVDLKPDVIRSAITARVARGGTDLIVVHHTAGQTLGPAVNTGINDADHGTYKGSPWGTQYEIDLDGHIVKFCLDTDVCNHSAPAWYCLHPEAAVVTPYVTSGAYSGKDAADLWDVNGRSVGIELVNYKVGATNDPYPVYQTRALLELLGRLVAHFPTVGFADGTTTRYRVAGHGDVERITNMQDSSRLGDPGRELPWPLLEAHGFGHAFANPPALGEQDYHGFFTLTGAELKALKGAHLSIGVGTNDHARNWGGVDLTTFDPKKVSADLKTKAVAFKDIVKDVQLDLRWLGYSTNADGAFTEVTGMAVSRFIAHVFSGARIGEGPGRGNERPGIVTATIAQYLRGAAARVRPAPVAAPAAAAAAPPAHPVGATGAGH